MRAPTTMPAPKVDADSSIAPSSGTRAAASPAARPAAMPPPSLPTERRSSAGSVSARRMLATARPGRKGQAHAVDQHRRVEHAHADAEHADAQQVEHHLPGRRLRQAHPHHRLHQHAHAAHAGHRGGGGLDVVGAVLAVGAVARGDGGAEQARQHLAADEEAEREVHVGRGHAGQRPQHEHADRGQQQVVLPAALRGQPGPARGGVMEGVRGEAMLLIASSIGSFVRQRSAVCRCHEEHQRSPCQDGGHAGDQKSRR